MTTKVCNKCQLEKPVTEYYRSKQGKDEYSYRCKACDAAYVANWRKRNPDHARRLGREADARYRANVERFNLTKKLKKHGLTESEYIELVGRYNGLCWLCREAPGTCIDHCHENKRVRGWLCRECNIALGLLKDNAMTIERALTYLNET